MSVDETRPSTKPPAGGICVNGIFRLSSRLSRCDACHVQIDVNGVTYNEADRRQALDGASMTCWSRFAKGSFVLVISVTVCLGFELLMFSSKGLAESAEQGEQTGKILSVRKVLRDPYLFSRYPHIRYYILYISLGVSDQTYCSEYETPVLDEIEDITTATSQDIRIVIKGGTIAIRTPRGRKLKARLAKGNQC
jgi:hypothetical protein